MRQIEEVWKSDSNFLRANISRFSSGLPPEKAGALRKELNRETSGASEPNLKSLLRAGFDRSGQEPANEFLLSADDGVAGPQRMSTALESSASVLYQHGYYT